METVKQLLANMLKDNSAGVQEYCIVKISLT